MTEFELVSLGSEATALLAVPQPLPILGELLICLNIKIYHL